MAENDPILKPPARHTYRLGAQLLCILCLIAAIVGVAAGYTVSFSERKYVIGLMDSEHEQKLELLVAAILENLISEDVPQIETSMYQLIRRDDYVRWVELKNETGKILFRYPKKGEPVRIDDDNFRVFSKNIVFEGENFGKFTVVWDTQPIINQGTARAFEVAVTIGAVCLFLGALFYVFIRIFMISPMQAISSEVNSIQRGDYGAGRSPALPRFVAAEIQNMKASVAALRHHLIRRKVYEAELQLATQAAQHANRSKSEFLANVSHELRTPLNAIIGFSEMIKLEVFGKIGDERYLSYIRDINASGEHLLELINDILDISRIEAGKLELRRTYVDIGETIHSGVTLVQPMVKEKSIDLTVSVPDGLSRIFVDGQRVQQIVINLLTNAVKFTKNGGQVFVSVQHDADGNIVIIIRDTGIGIAQENLEKILQPFEQIENAFTRQHSGSGLGLSITLALVEMHGGTLQMKSAVGKGTEVSVLLPRVQGDANAGSAAEAAAPADPGDGPIYMRIA